MTDSLISGKWTTYLRFTLLAMALAIAAGLELCE